MQIFRGELSVNPKIFYYAPVDTLHDTLGSYGIAPLGIVVAGPLAMHFGVNTILFVTGLTTLIAASLSLLVKSVRNLENP